MNNTDVADGEMDSSAVAKERKRRELAEEQLKQTQKELAEYKARVQSLSASKKGKDPLKALTGSFRVTSLSKNGTGQSENVSELSRKASALFPQNPSSRELKTILRQLIISGDETAKRLASNATTGNSNDLIAYLRSKTQEAYGGSTMMRRKETTRKEAAKAQELAELRAEGGIAMNPTYMNTGFLGFNSPPATPNTTPDAQKKAQLRFASKRERPQSYGHYIKPPSLNKSKVGQLETHQVNAQMPQTPVFPTMQQSIESQTTSGLLNLNDLTKPNSIEIGQFKPNPLIPLQQQQQAAPANFGLFSPMHSVFHNQYGFQQQSGAFGTFGMPFGGLNSPYINPMQPMMAPPQAESINEILLKSSSVPATVRPKPMQSFVPPTPVTKLVPPQVEPEKAKATKQPPRRWTEKEDELLRNSVKKYGARNWKNIATEVPGRNHVQCLQRWRKALDPKVVKGHWSPEEDAKLLQLVELNPKNWGHVARGIEGRTAKQCRERFHNHLDPSIKKGNWAFEEDKLIVLLQKQLGNKWAEIAKKLDGRTENSVKIRWKSIKRQVLALKEENESEEKQFVKRKIKRNTMDKERLDKLLLIWDFSE